MNKLILSIICFLCITGTSNAFFGSPSSIDLYKNIDKGVYDLEDKMIGFELSGAERKTGVIAELNQYAIYNELPACLDEGMEMSVGRFTQITEDQSVVDLKEYFTKECKGGINKDQDLIDLLTTYIDLFRSYLSDSTYVAEQKTKRIYQASSISMYSDGIAENSPFDLITDMEEIDKIIFNEVVDYEGEEYIDIEEEIAILTEGIDYEVPLSLFENAEITTSGDYSGSSSPSESPASISTPNSTSTNTNNELINNDSDEDLINLDNYDFNRGNDLYSTTKSTYICSDELDNTGLDPDQISFIEDEIDLLTNEVINNTENEINNNSNYSNSNTSNLVYNSTNSSSSSSSSSVSSPSTDLAESLLVNYSEIPIEVEPSESEYIKITDNIVWPCDSFFCININFEMYKQNLFGGGGAGMTIEYLIKRSNEHLSTFMGTSMIPATMTTNQFQLNLENLNLPDTFHIGFVIYKKPLPILDIEEPGEKDKTEYSGKSLIKEFYESNGLDYERRNDLVLLRDTQQYKKIANNSIGLPTKQVLDNITKYKTYKVKNDNGDTLTKIIEKKAGYGITQNFTEHFKELDKFSSSIVTTIEDIFIKIALIEKIPIDTAG